MKAGSILYINQNESQIGALKCIKVYQSLRTLRYTAHVVIKMPMRLSAIRTFHVYDFLLWLLEGYWIYHGLLYS